MDDPLGYQDAVLKELTSSTPIRHLHAVARTAVTDVRQKERHSSNSTKLSDVVQSVHPSEKLNYNIRDRSKRLLHVSNVITSFVPNALRKKFIAAPRLPVNPEKKVGYAAVLFADISGFSTMCRQLDAASVSKLINSIFPTIIDKVYNHGGDVLKFAGDALICLFDLQSLGDRIIAEVDKLVSQVSLCRRVIHI